MSNGGFGGYNLIDTPLRSSDYASAFQPAPFASPNPALIFRDPRRRGFPQEPPSMENPYEPSAAPGTSTTAPTARDFSAYDAFAPSGPSARPDIERDVFNPQMQEAMQRYSQAVNKPRAKMWRQVLGAFLGGQQPGTLGSFISGEEQRRQGIESAAQDYGLAAAQVQRQREMEMFGLQKENIGSEVAARQAATSLAGMEAPFRMELLKAQAEAANYEKVGDELYDLRTKKPIAGGSFPLTADEADALGNHKEGDLVSRDTKKLANAMALAGYFQTTTEEGVFMGRHGSHDLWKMGNSPRNIFEPGNRFGPYIMPEAPGEPHWARYKNMPPEAQVPTTSAEGITARATAKAMAPGGKVGEEINAFKTSLLHADLLLQAAKELNNPNSRTLASIKNRLATEFGDPDITNFEAIAHIYGNEIQKMVASNHLTNDELRQNAASMPSSANLATLTKVLGSYKALATSKLNVRRQGVEAGLQGKAAFPETGAGSSGKVIPF